MKIQKVVYISNLEDYDLDNGNIDVHLLLDDGRMYSFVIATPKNIYWCMDNENIDYFFGVPPIFVKKLTKENIESALQAIVTEDSAKWLNIYGVLQECIEDDE